MQTKRTFFSISFFTKILFSIAVLVPLHLFAATGTIDGTSFTAKFLDEGSRINFKPTNGTPIQITDNAITGYAWGENAGWINFAPTNGGVYNTTSGVLSGYAWGENAGWINFAPTNGGVTINTSNGQFSGYAWSQNFGWIQFNCGVVNACVKTNWTPTVTPPPNNPPPGVVPLTPPPVTPTCATDPTLCPVTPTCATNPSLCPPVTPTNPPPTNPSTPTTPQTPSPSSPPTPGQVNPPPTAVPPINPIPSIPTTNTPVVLSGVVQQLINSMSGINGAFIQAYQVLETGIKDKSGKVLSTIIGAFGIAGALFSIPEPVWRSFFSFFALRRRKPWGTVYDSITKIPLDPVYVILSDVNGNEVATCITDIDGRYGFLVPPGTYTISVAKTNYEFPSKKLATKVSDELYDDLYFGGPITLEDKDSAITRNIPMDALNFDWNEFEKVNKGVMRFYHRRDVIFAQIADIVFFLGFTLTTFSFFIAPDKLNIGILSLYIIMFVLKETGLRPRPHGTLYEKGTEIPLAFAIVRVYIASLDKEIMKKVSDANGRYFCLVTPGIYYLTIEKKNPDETYTLVHKTEPMKLTSGYISKNVEI